MISGLRFAPSCLRHLHRAGIIRWRHCQAGLAAPAVLVLPCQPSYLCPFVLFCANLGLAFNTLKVLWTHQRCCVV